MKAKLTKRTIDGLVPGEKEYFVFDTELAGFALRVYPSGRKNYLIEYRVAGRSTVKRKLPLGRHGEITTEEARTRASRLLAQARDGEDPAEERDARRKSLTVAELVELYLAEGPAEKPNKRASSWEQDRRNALNHVIPLLGNKPLNALTPQDVARFQKDVADGKTSTNKKTGHRGRSIVRGGKGTAARSLAMLGAMLTFAEKRKLIPSNPARGVPLYKGKRMERFLSEEELARLSETLIRMETEQRLHSRFAAVIRLLIVTGCRRNEILGLQWSEVDLERRAIVLSAERSKTGAKVVPLSSVAVELLKAQPREEGSPFVFPAIRDAKGPLVGIQKAWERVRDEAELPGLRLHDLRHSRASFLAADGASLYLIGKVLGHTQSRTTEIYAHLAADPIHRAIDLTDNRIADILLPERRAKGANVVKFPKQES